MFDWNRIRREVKEYTNGTDDYVERVTSRLFDLNPNASSINDFDYDEYIDIVIEEDSEN